MKCPLCEHDNLPGNAECESCGGSLTQEDVPQAVTLFENHLQNDGVSVLRPATPMTGDRRYDARRGGRHQCARNRSAASS